GRLCRSDGGWRRLRWRGGNNRWHGGRANAGHDRARGNRGLFRLARTIDQGKDNTGSRGGAYRGRNQDDAGGARKTRRRSQVTPFRIKISGRPHQNSRFSAVATLAISNRY